MIHYQRYQRIFLQISFAHIHLVRMNEDEVMRIYAMLAKVDDFLKKKQNKNNYI